MTQEKETWTSSQKTAFPYIQRAVSEGLTATDALKQYRSGGGSIRDAYWYAMFKEEFSFSGTRENVKQLPMTYTVTDTMFESVDYDFRENYVMQMKVRGYSAELKQTISKWVTVESSELVTKQEWQYGAQQAINDTLGSPDLVISRVLEWVPLQRSGKLMF